MSSFGKLKLLIWKNLIQQKRHIRQTVFEIASPVIFTFLLILIRCLVDPKSRPELNYSPFSPTYFDTNIKGMTTNLAYSPNTTLTRRVTQDAMSTLLADNLNMFDQMLASSFIDYIGYEDAKHLEEALTQPNAMNHILVGVQYDDNMANTTEWPDDIVVALRFPAIMRKTMGDHPLKLNWKTNMLFPLFPQPGPRAPDDDYGGLAPGYSSELFLGLQHSISQQIIRSKSGKEVHTKVYLQRLPQPAYRDDALIQVLERFVPIIIMLSFTYTFVNTVRAITAEKELQLKEVMAIMGLPSWLHWLAWFIKQLSFLLISVVIMVILFKIPFNSTEKGDLYAVLTFTPWSILLFFLILYMISSIAFSFMISALFTKASTAAAFMGLVWIGTFSAFMLTQMLNEDFGLTAKLLICLMSNSAMGYGFQMIVMSEGNSKGLQWENLFTPMSYEDQFQPGHVVLMLLLDTILYLLIALYVDKIRPGSYGVPLPWYFPFTKSFWTFNKTKVGELNDKYDAECDYNQALLNVVHDEEPQGRPVGVNIKNLTKIYKGSKRAVDSLNLRMYENEITVILGHNGAGKTTTISMLTGMISPTSGSASINGYNIVNETEHARKSLGICPQHNVLFPDLTVEEHLIFYSRLKGVHKKNIEYEVDHYVELLKLEEKRNTVARFLSGGQKRRLSVGAAMCGSSRVVLLDEPTSGLDPAARRALWDLLQKEKKHRTMILTTHFMDEADVLGDRIAIMSGGQLQCVGTPYFLKRHYGIGYKLTIVKGDHCKVEDITQFVKLYVHDVTENTNIGSELTYILPNEHVKKFPEMLKELDTKKESLRISSYGLTVTSLEEVFMKAGTEEGIEVITEKKNNFAGVYYNDNAVLPIVGQPENIMYPGSLEKVKGVKLLMNHVKAMFLKLCYNSIRSKMISFIQVISPVINISLSMVIAKSWQFVSHLPPLTLSLDSGFKRTETLMAEGLNLTGLNSERNYSVAYKDYFKTSKYPGMTLTDIGSMDVGKFYMKLLQSDPSRVQYETLTGATFSPDNITAWFSNYGYHDAAISLGLVDNAIMRAHSPGTSLKFVNSPLPYSVDNLVRIMASGSIMRFQFTFNMGFCMAIVAAFIVLFVIKERTSGAKLLQRVSGVRPAVMWSCALVWDWIWLLLVYFTIIITLAAYQESTFSTPEELGRVLIVLMVFSVAIIPVHYLASFCFKTAATGFTKMCFINIFCGCIPFLVTEILSLPDMGNVFYADLFDWIFLPLPLYSLCRSFRQLSVASFSIIACDSMCEKFDSIADCTRQTLCDSYNFTVCCIDDNPYMKWKEPGVGRYLVAMVLVGIISFTILLVKEYELLNRIFYSSKPLPLPPSLEEDDDVANERDTIESLSKGEFNQYSLVCKDLTKYYKKFLAVNRLSYGVRKGECFGLLGINGAGKTSTFRMLTGDAHISAGDAYVLGLSIKTRIQDVHANIGYCPQFDALFDNLTPRETLQIFGLLIGIPGDLAARRALNLAEMLGFLKHYDKKVHQCSGGTKRKISTSVALLGDSPLVFLDEPTTGMDPASKRLVWSSINSAVASGRSVVLTSHSMEECEALCSRLTVMVNGRLYCLGPLQHLKSKFSQGYTLIVKCKSGPDRDVNVSTVNSFVRETFNNARLVETYLGISTYYLSDSSMPWWRVFEVMQEACERLPIEDYSVAQTTLEQVFLTFTRSHDLEE